MNFLQLRFVFSVGYQGKFYAEAMLFPDRVEGLTVRPIRPETFEVGAVIDRDVWPEFYDAADMEIFNMSKRLKLACGTKYEMRPQAEREPVPQALIEGYKELDAKERL